MFVLYVTKKRIRYRLFPASSPIMASAMILMLHICLPTIQSVQSPRRQYEMACSYRRFPSGSTHVTAELLTGQVGWTTFVGKSASVFIPASPLPVPVSSSKHKPTGSGRCKGCSPLVVSHFRKYRLFVLQSRSYLPLPPPFQIGNYQPSPVADNLTRYQPDVD